MPREEVGGQTDLDVAFWEWTAPPPCENAGTQTARVGKRDVAVATQGASVTQRASQTEEKLERPFAPKDFADPLCTKKTQGQEVRSHIADWIYDRVVVPSIAQGDPVTYEDMENEMCRMTIEAVDTLVMMGVMKLKDGCGETISGVLRESDGRWIYAKTAGGALFGQDVAQDKRAAPGTWQPRPSPSVSSAASSRVSGPPVFSHPVLGLLVRPRKNTGLI